MDKLRLRFSKTGRAVYISHLDLMRTMQRAFLRAGYALKYSEGFNPHPQISILLPLSVGCGSVCELMDFTLMESPDLAELPRRLTRALPEGIRALEAYAPQTKAKLLKWVEIEGRFEYDGREPAALAENVNAFFARESIVIRKKTKRGEGDSDIAHAIKSFHAGAWEDAVSVHAIVSAQEPTLNPELLPSALRQLAPELAPDFAEFTRIEVFQENMSVFR